MYLIYSYIARIRRECRKTTEGGSESKKGRRECTMEINMNMHIIIESVFSLSASLRAKLERRTVRELRGYERE